MLKQYTILFLLCLCAHLNAITDTQHPIGGTPSNNSEGVQYPISETQSALSLRDCMEYAIAHSAKMEIQRANNDDARIARREAILRAFTPTIQGGTYASLNFGRGIDPETNNYNSTTSFNNGYSLSGAITLFNGFSAVNNLKITKTAIKMGIAEEQQLRDQICLAVMEAYCNVLYFTQMTEALQVQVTTATSNLQLAQRQEQLGQKSHADVIQLEADLAEREYQHITMTNQFNDARMTLQDLMLWEEDHELLIDPQTAQNLTPSHTSDLTAVDEAVSSALHHPSVELAAYRMANAQLDLSTARWRLAPSLSLSGGWSTGYYTYPRTQDYVAMPFASQFINNSGEYVQLSLSIPIYDGLSRQSNIVRKKNAYRRAEAEYRQTLREVEAEMARAVQDRDGAMAALKQADRRAKAQQEAYAINSKKFEQGLISPLELKTSSDNHLNAQAEHLNAQLKYFIKSCVVRYYNGTPYLEQL